MTKQEWLECQDPEELLQEVRGRISERQLCLFNAACMRDPDVWCNLDDHLRAMVVNLERYTNGEEDLWPQYLSLGRREQDGWYAWAAFDGGWKAAQKGNPVADSPTYAKWGQENPGCLPVKEQIARKKRQADYLRTILAEFIPQA